MFKSGKTLVYCAVTEMHFYILNYSSIYYHLLAGHINNVIANILLTTARVSLNLANEFTIHREVRTIRGFCVVFPSAPPEIECLLLCINFGYHLLALMNTLTFDWHSCKFSSAQTEVFAVLTCAGLPSRSPSFVYCVDEKEAQSEQTGNQWKATTIPGQIHLTKNLCWKCVVFQLIAYDIARENVE